MKKLAPFGILASLACGLTSAPVLAEPTISFVESIQVTAHLKAGKWSTRKNENNRIRMEVSVEPKNHGPKVPMEYFLFFAEEQVKLKNGEWAKPIEFSLSPTRLESMNLKFELREYGFKAKYTGFDWFDVIPYVIESATDKHPLPGVQITLSVDALQRIAAGEAVPFEKSYADGSELVFMFRPAAPVERTLTALKSLYQANCRVYAKQLKSGKPIDDRYSISDEAEKLANLRRVIQKNDSVWNEKDCTARDSSP